MRKPMRVLAGCALLAVTSCSIPAAGGGTSTSGPNSDTTAVRASTTAPVVTFGEPHRFKSGLVVTVSKPTAFQPSDEASPPSENALAFEISVRNETGHLYQLSEMAVTLIADGVRAERVIDPTQGYTGVVAPQNNGLPTNQRTQVNVAFAVPPEPAELKLTFRPRSTKPAKKVVYVTSSRSPARQ